LARRLPCSIIRYIAGKERRLVRADALQSQQWYLRRGGTTDLAERVQSEGAQTQPLDPLLAKVLYARKIDTPDLARGFLYPPDDAADPLTMAGMPQAVERLIRALREGEPIAVYGDFDADGVTATALLTLALRALGGTVTPEGTRVTPYIPDRFNEAYGLNKPALKRLYEAGNRLVVTVDCGVRSVAEVAYANALGLDVVITDHHSVPRELPPALAVIDPKREDCAYPFKELAGVGVAYRLAQALYEAAGGASDPSGFLDLVAVGTVADIVPLRDENRSLAQRGLARLRASARPGLDALATVAGIPREEVDSTDIAFRLGPRLNAAGRLLEKDGNGQPGAHLALDLLLTQDPERARELAATLNQVNIERQRLLEDQLARARELLGDAQGRSILFVHDPDFHEGIVGLIASRLSDEFYRPSLVMRRGERSSRGSARSIEGIHITHALDENAALLTRWGGHALAAGVTLPTANLDALEERLAAYCAAHLDGVGDGPKQFVDAIVTLNEITPETPAALAMLEPFGEGNPEPALATRKLRVMAMRAVGQDGKHLRLDVKDGRVLPAIAFRLGHMAKSLRVGDSIDLVYRPTLNVWQGQASLQLVVQAIRPAA
jgi:single-stranded-DNA-specific exonuclease